MPFAEIGVKIGLLGGGFALWTLVEYCGHRWLMHGAVGPLFIRLTHAEHHRNPSAMTWSGSARFASAFLLGLAGATAVAAIVLGPLVWSIAVGVALGSVAYSLAHRYAHSESFTPAARSESAWTAHLRHHSYDTRAGFGSRRYSGTGSSEPQPRLIGRRRTDGA